MAACNVSLHFIKTSKRFSCNIHWRTVCIFWWWLGDIIERESSNFRKHQEKNKMNALESFSSQNTPQIHTYTQKHQRWHKTFRVKILKKWTFCHSVQRGFSFFFHHRLSDLCFSECATFIMIIYTGISTHQRVFVWAIQQRRRVHFWFCGCAQRASRSGHKWCLLFCSKLCRVSRVLAELGLYIFLPNGRNMMWERAWLTGINGRNCSKADKVLIP